MSYTYLLGQGEESWAECFSDIPACVLSRLNLTADESCCRDSGTESCHDSPSGTTSEHSTEPRGKAELMSSVVVFPVRTFLSEEKGLESAEAGRGSGHTKPASLAKYDPDSRTWKTRQRSLLGGLVLYSETWPRWGTTQDGELFPLPTLADITLENDCGFSLPTIGKNEFKGASRRRYWRSKFYRGAKMAEGVRTSQSDPIYLSPSFSEEAMMWPIMWTALEPLGMDKFQQWRHSHGDFLEVQ